MYKIQYMNYPETIISEPVLYSWLTKFKKIILKGETAENIIQAICKTAVEYGPFNLAWYGEQLPKKPRVMPSIVFPENTSFPESDGFGILSLAKSPAAVTWNQSRIFVVNQISSDVNFQDWQSMALADGYEAVVAIPVVYVPYSKGILVLYSKYISPVSRDILVFLEEFSALLARTLSILHEKSLQSREISFLTKQEEMYRSVFENTGTGTIIIDYDMTIMHANAKFLSMVGYTKDEVENKMKWSQFVAPQDNERMQSYHFGRRRKEPGIPTTYECRIIDRSGRLRYIDMQVGMIPDSMHSIASFMDITKRKLAEEQLKESESRLSAIIEAFEDFIYISDAEYRIIFMNKSLSERVGMGTTNSYCYKVIHGFDRPCEWCEQAKVLSGHTVKREIKSPFDDRWYSFTRTPVVQIDGKVERIQTILIDVTDRKVAEEALVKKADVLSSENRRLRTSIKERYKFGDIIGKSPAMQSVYELILKAATSNAHVIIQGESGTGKELVARAIHNTSERKGERFVPVNCGAISSNIIESEFFGYKKGAFTGANRDKAGYLDIADRGTLFLDEIGEIALNIQVKLLRAIEGGGYTPVGDNIVKHANLRIVAATNRNLRELVKQGDMREDFFYRVHVIPIQLPPLRERKEDLPLLIDHFISKFNLTQNIPRISGNMLEVFMNYQWPGNIRELENSIKRHAAIGNLDFFHSFASDNNSVIPEKEITMPTIPNGITLEEAITFAEKETIKRVIETCRWNRSLAAKALGIHRKTLFTKMKKHGIE
ncbi:MAG: sigma 54-interacting transcriptional regulator [Desulfamplus sp.]|nr:sigma 54-interacting transcriptional regulator [Desulfamplus sp.]